jgi:hypothetical protein
MSNPQHPHPGVPPDLFNTITVVMVDTGETKRLMYQYYAAPAGQAEKTVNLPDAIVQTGGEPLFPPDFKGGIQKMNWSDDESE